MRTPTDINCAYHVKIASSRGPPLKNDCPNKNKNKLICNKLINPVDLLRCPLSPCYTPIMTLTHPRSYAPEASPPGLSWYGSGPCSLSPGCTGGYLVHVSMDTGCWRWRFHLSRWPSFALVAWSIDVRDLHILVYQSSVKLSDFYTAVGMHHFKFDLFHLCFTEKDFMSHFCMPLELEYRPLNYNVIHFHLQS